MFCIKSIFLKLIECWIRFICLCCIDDCWKDKFISRSLSVLEVMLESVWFSCNYDNLFFVSCCLVVSNILGK